ncbi:MAG TPA: polyprenyl synthetase family protein [Desulfovibrio sp.]|jgi:octaprenyl-diphosphate synthase|uniref:polyprenyl synthetase family protein n=1 Tax=Desulfovibrio TaxID=872 RepID=UPI002A3868D9|nr:polyprenyl synthetase family protein [Desulfovibrio sp.]MDY0306841.1 polyprenyl synthetase family protein [Desulfovibrionaceae bacterium]HMM37642.1 polyprenyl synthetase family protein [Desulfovibrio sp.]
MNDLLAYFEQELPVINAFLEVETGKLDGLVRDVARYVLLGGGKRIRPVLTILSARALGYPGDDVAPLACALEMLHSATLIHDDILDGAETRRRKTAAHLTFGATETILAGDALLALANRLGAGYDIPRINYLLAEGIMATAAGEIREIAHVAEARADRGIYLEIIIGKTARLIETACRCGAALASPERELEDAAGTYGLNVGVAFQLVDDALDYISPESVTGKPEGGDLREGKLTWPLLLFLEEEPDGSEVLARIRDKSLDEAARREIVARVRDKGYADRTRAEAARYVGEAKRALAALPGSREREILVQAADFVLARRK